MGDCSMESQRLGLKFRVIRVARCAVVPRSQGVEEYGWRLGAQADKTSLRRALFALVSVLRL